MSDYQLVTGDCREALAAMRAESVDAIIADPPYGIDYQSARRTDKTLWKPKIANDRRPFIWWLGDAERVLKSPGALVCFCRWDVQEVFRMAIAAAGLEVRSQVVWNRMAHGMGDLEGSFAPQHDILWFAAKGAFRFHGPRPKSVLDAMRLPGENLTHPNEKPYALAEMLVLALSPSGGTVLDPFCGSGVVGEAARVNGRSFVGIELNPEYAEMARRRIGAAPLSLFAALPAEKGAEG